MIILQADKYKIMKVLFRYIKTMAPYLLAAWIIIILIFSSIPRVPEIKINTGRLEIKIDYILHFGEYFALAGLALLAFAGSDYSLLARKILVTTLSLLVFAVLDESHQLLIPGRSFNISDMLSNFAGILSGIIITLHLNRSLSRET